MLVMYSLHDIIDAPVNLGWTGWGCDLHLMYTPLDDRATLCMTPKYDPDALAPASC
jgi:hypothetical protein